MTTDTATNIRFEAAVPQFTVPDLVRTAEYYRDVLGFTLFAGGKHPNGTRNSGPALESGYLELITPWDPTKTIGGGVAKFLAARSAAKVSGVVI